MAKGPEAFRTISEASLEIGVAQHVLRYWETKFWFIRPLKRAGGRRFYRPRDILTLSMVRRLLHDEGRSIKDVQQLYRRKQLNKGANGALRATTPGAEQTAGRLQTALATLETAKLRLDRALAGA